ncbi:hypothetical protein N7495_000864 [Penicillium taxi]|uniref:uncharacterized protein n=1 Tax=Penicillium taxi TaxID=168475 RepID=UPI002545AA95|nr:uncharacterized protein N7495_000864 [Penicillium taxi]KAJ5908182.1 hypothetical protein N7495_000864 [Penicillium taxi]
MSDDEDYYEWEEEYLFEDLVPDLVDELAANGYYEAGLYEDPAIEVEDYYSDWDYYSDDYYDDDPSVKPRTVRARAKGTKTRGNPEKNRGVLPQSTCEPDVTSFQGVIWKTPSHERDQDVSVQIYEPGNGAKVALLENWREIFKSVQPSLDKSRLRKKPTRESVPSVEDEILCDDEQSLDSSDEMSDVVSVDHTTASGDISNTTPEAAQSPEPEPKLTLNSIVTTPVKRGRKRKADIPVTELDKENSGGTARARPKRVAQENKSGGTSSASTGPVRRSTRQKK